MVLPHRAAAAEFVDGGAQRAIVQVSVVTSELLVENADARSHRPVDLPDEDLEVAADIGRRTDLDVLSRFQVDDRPRVHHGLADPLLDQRLPPFLHEFFQAHGLGHGAAAERDEHGRNLLADHFGVFEDVQLVRQHQSPGQPRLASDLTDPPDLHHVEDLLRGDAARHAATLVPTGIGVARVMRVHPIGRALAERCELDAPDDVVGAELLRLLNRAVLALHQLHLQRDTEAVIPPPDPKPTEHLAGLDRGPDAELLLSVETELTGWVGFQRPLAPEFPEFLV